MALLVAGAIAIVGAGLRESDLDPGRRARRPPRRARPDGDGRDRGGPGAGDRRRAALVERRGGALPASHLQADAGLGHAAELRARSTLTLSDPGWLRWRHTDDLIPDHGHLMHLFLVRAPGLDAIAHLHPRRTGEATFAQAAPPLPAGSYRLFGDIVHQTGLDETVTAALDLAGRPRPATPAAAGARFDPDDAMAIVPRAATVDAPSFAFADGSGRLRWLDARAPRAGETVALAFEVEEPDGRPAAGLEPYMGMAGHAMIVARDFSVFAHVHPTGSVPMAAMALVEGAARGRPRPPPRDDVRAARPVPLSSSRAPATTGCSFRSSENGRVETAACDLTVR